MMLLKFSKSRLFLLVTRFRIVLSLVYPQRYIIFSFLSLFYSKKKLNIQDICETPSVRGTISSQWDYFPLHQPRSDGDRVLHSRVLFRQLHGRPGGLTGAVARGGGGPDHQRRGLSAHLDTEDLLCI